MSKMLSMLASAIGFCAVLASQASAEMVYHRGNTAEPETLDPNKASTTYEANILRDLFEGLVMPDARANIIPGVAESWRISDDQTVYTFELRADAVWSNGDPVTADDFVYAFRRLADPATAAEYASMLYVVRNAEAITAAAAGARPEKRMELLSQAEKVLVDAHGLLPLLFYSSHNIVSSRIKGWEENVMDIHPSRFITVGQQ